LTNTAFRTKLNPYTRRGRKATAALKKVDGKAGRKTANKSNAAFRKALLAAVARKSE